ncbi:MAG: HDOD domain-containing protein [Rhodocyclaceae bacterium]|jgi:HD-like signal output (HDOD) protein|nr:HDOD domain-containing protein [Rhodocyclaceae bacterium]MBK6554847.1 HDOD domain-containing protein [Rhodocyclaceae bacterium]MBK6677195.1 HDOD domain-containing protein [Rhodocyclaceae bacterium]MBK9309874.1 HDOD domain-containing protein [Rhodocyclaceae bacterium]MBK9953640.1 HDOD domain-containing protein [Rhodocyclaceae bacterium]
MSAEVSRESIEQLLKQVTIPPRPALLIELDRELGGAEPDFRAVAALVGKDVGISAAMLKTLNSPLFALRSKIGNVTQAVQLLGMRNVRNIVTGLMLRNMVGAGQNLERFWDSAEKVAAINAYLCSILPKTPRDEAYTFGLFRDCGIPILMQRFPEYRDTLKRAAGDDRPMPVVEDERHGTNHATVGYMVARSWGLSDAICQSILRHHDIDMINGKDSTVPLAHTLVAINFFAEHLNDTMLRMRQDSQWELHGEMVLDYLGITHKEYVEIQDDVMGLGA